MTTSCTWEREPQNRRELPLGLRPGAGGTKRSLHGGGPGGLPYPADSKKRGRGDGQRESSRSPPLGPRPSVPTPGPPQGAAARRSEKTGGGPPRSAAPPPPPQLGCGIRPCLRGGTGGEREVPAPTSLPPLPPPPGRPRADAEAGGARFSKQIPRGDRSQPQGADPQPRAPQQDPGHSRTPPHPGPGAPRRRKEGASAVRSRERTDSRSSCRHMPLGPPGPGRSSSCARSSTTTPGRR